METLNNRIQQHLNQKNMTQNDLSEKIGARRETVNKWINGRSIPDTFYALKMSKILNVKVEDLFKIVIVIAIISVLAYLTIDVQTCSSTIEINLQLKRNVYQLVHTNKGFQFNNYKLW